MGNSTNEGPGGHGSNLPHPPAAISLGGHIIPIIRVDEVPGEDDEHVFGLYDEKTMTIQIRKDLTPTMAGEVFWHEIIEAINDMYELKLPHPKIQTLGVALHQVVQSLDAPIQRG